MVPEPCLQTSGSLSQAEEPTGQKREKYAEAKRQMLYSMAERKNFITSEQCGVGGSGLGV